MHRLVFAAMLFIAGCTTVVSPNYRDLANKTVPTNVELIGNFYNLWTGETRENAAYCSGVAVTPTKIITAGHCVNAAQNIPAQNGVALFDGKIKVRLHNGKVVLADIVQVHFKEGTNGDSRDVALLFVPEGEMTAASIGDSDTLAVGDQVAIVGNTFGELAHSFTVGVVSYVNRKLNVGTFIQTDALSGGGNSGGPVFDMEGNLIGILVRGGGGVSLALPINDVLVHLGLQKQELQADGR